MISLLMHWAKTKAAIILATVLLFSFNCSAQNAPLKGSGNIVSKTFALAGFDQLAMEDLDGIILVEVGKPFSITADIDDNLSGLLDVSVAGGRLTVLLKGNRNNRLYIEDTKISIKICLPSLTDVFHRSNGRLTINNIDGKYLKIKNTGNGSAILNGSIDELDIVCRGNGSVNAGNLTIKNLTVKRSGNGNVYANAGTVVTAQNTGNGNLINGKGSQNEKQADIQSALVRPMSVIKNLTGNTIKLGVQYPVKGSYGIDIKPQESVEEYFPVGTKIYKGNQFNRFKKVLFVITEQNRKGTFTVR
jgi:hypothetical protein